ncbi:MAG: alanine--tRNA ligase [Armatimonadetes bacterium]|nr:MAG: alanine--tRNA ligase [Armatimonadota bacterium]
MNSNDVRSTFLDFFEANDHTRVHSASLIPVDPALLLTVAGMVPFKPFLLGEEVPPYPRAVSSQKCIRTADIEVLGTTARHLSFFEMLGSFSFGDYFKETAIPLAYELLTEQYGLDPDRLWYTVHDDDDEAAEIWIDDVGIDPNRVQRTDRDNFWQMGVAGPAGPDSEVFFDRGPDYGKEGGPIVDEDRYMEICNLVFMQYVQDEPFHVVGDLPMKSIDTGMGLERMAMVLQGVESVFETDMLRAVMAVGENRTGVSYGADERSDVSLRILADHGRALTFLINDGVVPSNEGRGYILRRLLRRVVRHAHLLGSTDPIVPALVDVTVAEMGVAYPELVANADFIKEMAEREEEGFTRTLASGEQLLREEIEAMGSERQISGSVAFKLHDTFGFPIDLTVEIAADHDLTVDREAFDVEMTAQRNRARAAFKADHGGEEAETYRTVLGGIDQSAFVGYDALDSSGTVLSILVEGDTVARAEEGTEVEIFVDTTPFYAESGGQVGDTGTITTETGVLKVLDTQFALPGVHGHKAKVIKGSVRRGQDAALAVDGMRRERTRKNHTGTHILHWALRDVIGDHVHQAGSLVAPDRLRFDFSHFQAVAPAELHHIEREVNERIIANEAVTTIETSKEEAEKMGAIAFFGDKYGETVRVVNTGSYSIEFCGGTHVPSTGQVGPLVLVSEGSVGSNIRRVEALTGSAAYGHLSDLRATLTEVSEVLRTQPGRVVDTARSLTEQLHATEARLGEFEERDRANAATTLVNDAEDVGPAKLVSTRVDGLGADGVRSLAFQIRDRIGSGVGILGSVTDGKAAFVVFVTDDLVDDATSAGAIASHGAAILGGGGSKDPRLAQAGGPHAHAMDEAISAATDAARAALTSP